MAAYDMTFLARAPWNRARVCVPERMELLLLAATACTSMCVCVCTTLLALFKLKWIQSLDADVSFMRRVI